MNSHLGVIWPQQAITEDLLDEFGAEEAAEDEKAIAPAERSEAPAAEVFGEAADPSEARGGDIELLPKRSKLNAKQRDILAKKQKQQQTCEENWGGYCKGECGKYITGEYVCHECRTKAAEVNFALKPGEVELYRGPVGKPEDKVVKQIVVKDASKIEPDDTTWVWEHRIPEGAITWCLGQPNNAKSLLTIEVAACATTGRDWPDWVKNTMPPSKVLMYCGEDSLSKIVVPRLMAAGADLAKIGFLDRKSFRTVAGDNNPEKRPLDLSQDCDTLIELIKQNPELWHANCDWQ